MDRVHKFFIGRAIVFFVLLVVAVSGYFLFKAYKISQIDSFEKCAKYYPVMESYPAQCRANGKTFVEPIN